MHSLLGDSVWRLGCCYLYVNIPVISNPPEKDLKKQKLNHPRSPVSAVAHLWV
jgi:hypothetical protein